MIGKILKIIGITLLAIIIVIVLLVFAAGRVAAYRNAHYFENAKPAGAIERKYTAMGPHSVSYVEYEADDADGVGKYEIWYPSDAADSDRTYPLVVMANGTGVKASAYAEVFRHLASWGFVVAGNEDEWSWYGGSSSETLAFALRQNDDASSVLHGLIDTENIGIAGHSQGGVGAINAVTSQDNGSGYRAMWTASATHAELAEGLGWPYDVSRVGIPYMMVAGTGAADGGDRDQGGDTAGIAPLSSLEENYDAIPDGVPKVMARERGRDHGDMLRYADGYMTAWFSYWLKGDAEAGQAFFGTDAELATNPNWQDVRICAGNQDVS